MVRELEVAVAHVRHDLARILEEQAAAQHRHLEQEVLEHIVADVRHPEQVQQHIGDLAVEAEHPHEILHRLPVVALQHRQHQRGRSPAGLARHHHVRVAVDGREGQLVVLHRVHLAAQHLRGEIVAAGHRQHRVMEALAHLVRQLQAVPAGAHHHRARLEAGIRGLHDEQLTLTLDALRPLVVLHLDLRALDALCLAHEGSRQGLEIDRGVLVLRPQRDQRLGAQVAIAVGDRRLDARYVLGLQQLQARIVRGQDLETLPQALHLAGAYAKHHFRIFENQMIDIGLRRGVAFHHTRRTLHLQRLLQAVVGLDIAAVQGLAVVAVQGVDPGRRCVFLEQADMPDAAVTGRQIQQCGPGYASPDDQQVKRLAHRLLSSRAGRPQGAPATDSTVLQNGSPVPLYL